MNELKDIEDMFRGALKGRIVKEVNLTGSIQNYNLKLTLSKDGRSDVKIQIIDYMLDTEVEE